MQEVSVKELQFYCGRIDFMQNANLMIMHSFSLSFNLVIHIWFLISTMSNEYRNLCINFNCTTDDCSLYLINNCVLVF